MLSFDGIMGVLMCCCVNCAAGNWQHLLGIFVEKVPCELVVSLVFIVVMIVALLFGLYEGCEIRS